MRITHPFHPLRDQRFLVLKRRQVAGQQTLILQGAAQGTFAVAVDWTDWQPSDSDPTTATILEASALQALAILVEQLLQPTHAVAEKGVAR